MDLDASRPLRHGPWSLALPLALALAMCLWLGQSPIFGAGFSNDDWAFLALAKHIASPWYAYWQDHTASYAYRPNGFLLWWASVRVFGTDPFGHYLVNAGLHILNALLIAGLCRSFGVKPIMAACAAVLFVVHPSTAGSSWWLSSRFDLLCLSGMLGAIIGARIALRDGSWRGYVLLVLATLLAAGAKELAVLIPVIVTVLAFIASDIERRRRLYVVAVSALPILLLLIMRRVLTHEADTSLGVELAPQIIWQGMGNWISSLPMAVLGSTAQVSLGWWLPILALLGVAGWVAYRHRQSGAGALTGLGLLIALMPVLVVWPVTSVALDAPNALQLLVNHRFYYLALAGVVIAIGGIVASIETLGRWPGWAMAIVTLVVSVLSGTRQHL